jgi:hypothetical protein
MSEVEQMANKIKELEGQLRTSELRYERLEGSRNSTVVVSSTKERKIEIFTASKDVDEWIQNVELFINKKLESEREKVNYIIDHLHNDVKTEIRLEIDPMKSTSRELLKLLKDIYGIKKTWFELEVEYYARNQHDGETLMQYSHELMTILFLLQKKSSEPKKDSDKMLKQKFADGVLDPDLQQELKRLNRENSSLKFYELRQLAIDWRNNRQSQAAKIDALMETVSLQQQQIDVMNLGMQNQSKKVAEVAEQTYYNRGRGNVRSRGRFRGRSRGRSWNRGGHSFSNPRESNSKETTSCDDNATCERTMRCHYCSELNHISTYCWKRLKDMEKRRDSKSKHSTN